MSFNDDFDYDLSDSDDISESEIEKFVVQSNVIPTEENQNFDDDFDINLDDESYLKDVDNMDDKSSKDDISDDDSLLDDDFIESLENSIENRN